MACKPRLVRLAAVVPAGGQPATVVIDSGGKLPGRGAYICREVPGEAPNHDCLARALARKAFARAFRRAVNVPSELVESVGR